MLTGYRDHGHALAMGMTANSLMAELFGKATGCIKGKGGSMHFFDEELGMLGGNGIVGSHIPVATGVAFAQKYRNEKKVTLGFFGDGAAQQGAVHEAMNLRRTMAPAGDLCSRKQPIRHGHIRRAFERHEGTAQARRRLQFPGRDLRWHGCA